MDSDKIYKSVNFLFADTLHNFTVISDQFCDHGCGPFAYISLKYTTITSV